MIAHVRVVVLFTMITIVSSVSSAAPITYVFSNASAVLNGQTEQITGSFVFDPVTLLQTFASITLTGSAPWAGTYTDTVTREWESGAYVLAAPTPSTFVWIDFALPLDAAPNPLSRVFARVDGVRSDDDTNPTGTVSPVPEPSNFVLLAAALALFPLCLKRWMDVDLLHRR